MDYLNIATALRPGLGPRPHGPRLTCRFDPRANLRSCCPFQAPVLPAVYRRAGIPCPLANGVSRPIARATIFTLASRMQ